MASVRSAALGYKYRVQVVSARQTAVRPRVGKDSEQQQTVLFRTTFGETRVFGQGCHTLVVWHRVPRVKSHHRKRGGNTRVSHALAYCPTFVATASRGSRYLFLSILQLWVYCSTFVAAASRGICLCLSGADSARQPSCRFSKGAAKTADSAVEPSCRFNKGAAPIADSAIKPSHRFSEGAAIREVDLVRICLGLSCASG